MTFTGYRDVTLEQAGRGHLPVGERLRVCGSEQIDRNLIIGNWTYFFSTLDNNLSGEFVCRVLQDVLRLCD